MANNKPTKRERVDYLTRKYMGSDSELTPRNIQFELEDGCEFCYTRTPSGGQGITIKQIK